MDPWVIWIIAAVALAAGEIGTAGFVLAPFAAGALLAALAALVGVPFGASVAVFLVASVAALTLLRPIAKRHTRMPPQIRTGTDRLLGQQAMVLERIANDEAVGCVRLDGEVWTARAYDEDVVIPAGEKVQVVAIKGATALVTEV